MQLSWGLKGLFAIIGLDLGAVVSANSGTSSTNVSGHNWDYIVVGSGPAGLIIADRLSEAGKSVLLLERGGPSTKETGGHEVPPWANSTGLTRFDIPYLFQTIFSAEHPWWWCDDVATYAGCLLGGGASINGLWYWIPPDSDFGPDSGWPNEWRDPSRGINRLLARLPSYESPSSDGRFYLDQIYEVLKTHYSKKGFTETTINPHRNNKDKVFGRMEYNFNNGIRSGATHTYLQTAKRRKNFKMLTWTYAESVVRNGGHITGVQTNNTIDLPNGLASLKANGRVILSAGCFGTAKILFKSGIGPSDMIQLVEASDSAHLLPPSSQYIDLPVGYYVSDSPTISVEFAHPSVEFNTSQDVWSSPNSADASQYLSDQSGLFATAPQRFSSWRALDGPDGVTRYVQAVGAMGGLPPSDPAINASTVFAMSFWLTQGITSRGRIGINGSLTALSLVDPWFRDVNDKAMMINAIEDAFLNLTTNVPGLVHVYPSASQSAEFWVNNYPIPLGSNHWVGSTRIGTNSSTSVVDLNCRVWGTDNLFIVDAGIIPSQPMSNTQAAVYTVAELAVERILAFKGH